MCGLVGVAGQIMNKDVEAFHDLIWIDSVRGRDGCGLAKVQFGVPDKAYITKVSGDAANLFDTKSYWQLLNPNSMLLLGHNRYKTHGDASWKNAHPFRHGNIIGAHNGVISNKYKLKEHNKFDTDSEAVVYNIAENGIEATIKLLEGSWAFVWYDISDGTLNFVRNKERPLYYVFNETHDTIFWASEAPMIYHVLNRHNIPFEGKTVKLVPEDIHFKMKLPTEPRKQIPEPIRKKLERFQDPFWERTALGKMKWVGHKRGSPSSSNGTNGPNLGGTPTTAEKVFELGPPKEDSCNAVSSIRSIDTNGARLLSKDELVPGFEAAIQKQMYSMKEVISGPSNSKGAIRLSRLIKPKKGKSQDAYYLGYDTNHDVYSREEFEKIMGEGCAYCSCSPVWGEPVKFLKDNSFLCIGCVSEPLIIDTVHDIL